MSILVGIGIYLLLLFFFLALVGANRRASRIREEAAGRTATLHEHAAPGVGRQAAPPRRAARGERRNIRGLGRPPR